MCVRKWGGLVPPLTLPVVQGFLPTGLQDFESEDLNMNLPGLTCQSQHHPGYVLPPPQWHS